jgi:hypothetical protein
MFLSIARNAIILLFAGMLAACSMQGMIETMTSEEDREMVQEFVDNIQAGDSAALEAMVDPDIWKESAGQLEGAAAMFPEGESETQIISYSMHTSSLDADARTEKEFTLVTTDETRWTTTTIATLQDGGPQRIVRWNVESSNEPPAGLENLETFGKVFMWAGIVALLVIAGIVVLIVFLVRRANRKNRERAGIS